jgi:hypothetical protein
MLGRDSTHQFPMVHVVTFEVGVECPAGPCDINEDNTAPGVQKR